MGHDISGVFDVHRTADALAVREESLPPGLEVAGADDLDAAVGALGQGDDSDEIRIDAVAVLDLDGAVVALGRGIDADIGIDEPAIGDADRTGSTCRDRRNASCFGT